MYQNMQVRDFLVLPATASYCDVARYGLAKVLDFLVLPATASYCDVARYGLAKHSCIIEYSTYQYIPVSTCTYWYVPEHEDTGKFLGPYVPGCSDMYCPVLSWYKVVQGGTRQYKERYMEVHGGTWRYKNL